MTKVKVIELEGMKLTPGAKYIFMVHPHASPIQKGLAKELERLIGRDNFTIGIMDSNHLKVYEVLPQDGEDKS